MTYALHHAVLAVLCPLIAWPLARTRLAWRVPRTAIVVWQALGCTWVLCIIGVALGWAWRPTASVSCLGSASCSAIWPVGG